MINSVLWRWLARHSSESCTKQKHLFTLAAKTQCFALHSASLEKKRSMHFLPAPFLIVSTDFKNQEISWKKVVYLMQTAELMKELHSSPWDCHSSPLLWWTWHFKQPHIQLCACCFTGRKSAPRLWFLTHSYIQVLQNEEGKNATSSKWPFELWRWTGHQSFVFRVRIGLWAKSLSTVPEEAKGCRDL